MGTIDVKTFLGKPTSSRQSYEIYFLFEVIQSKVVVLIVSEELLAVTFES